MNNQEFGQIGNDRVELIEIRNINGLSAKLMTYGACLVSLEVPDREGRLDDIVLGFDTLDEYVSTNFYFGATCGRYANRIAGGRFSLLGQDYQLNLNEGPNHLHGGESGFDAKIWMITEQSASRVKFEAVSADGEMGYPGRCLLWVSYELTDDDTLLIAMEAESDAVTLMNMANHSYFNLGGQGNGDILDHHMRLNSRFYTPVGDDLLTTGEVCSVEGTAFDFSAGKLIGQDIADMLSTTGGYDHNWCVGGAGNDLRDVVDLHHPGTGRQMRLRSTEPGIQIYTGNHLPDIGVKGGKRIGKYGGVALETQRFPGTPSFAHFPNCVLHPGERYCHKMEFGFGEE